MMAAVPTCPACGEDVDNTDGQLVYHDGNVDHARRTLAHAMRLARPPEVG